MTDIYGIKNCDTMKKAFKWLDAHHIDYTFHDYKKGGFDKGLIESAINAHGWDAVLNKRGTSWRQLPPTIQSNMDDKKALEIAETNPSIIKRPLLYKDKTFTIGFSDDKYAKIFNV
ncbi:MAG: ArsC family reductase [Alphaproteobacteria bacterium]